MLQISVSEQSMKMTLKAVCNHVGVTRRAIQGYEKAGLVKPTDKNKYGHLLYDEAAIEKIVKIKQYQNFGFSIKEIQALQNLSEEEVLKKLKSKLQSMQLEMQKLKENIDQLEQLIAVQYK